MAEVPAVVSGGGIAGLSTALTLSRSKRRVVLLDERSDRSTLGVSGIDLRSIALSPASLEYLGELEFPSEVGAAPIKKMLVWEQDGTASISFQADEIQADYLAKVMQNHSVVSELRSLVEAESSIEVVPDRIAAIEVPGQRLTLNGGREIECELLVIAEGFNSNTADLLNVRRHQRSLKQHAVVSVLTMSQNHDDNAWQKFGNTPLALLPYAGKNIVSLIWSMPDDEFDEQRSLDDASFATLVTNATEACCGDVEKVDRRLSFPLQHSYVEDMNPVPWAVVVGDAARTIHPLAGQGINLGIEDVRGIRRVLETNPRRLDDPRIWREYATKRKVRSMMMLALMRGLAEVWSFNGPNFRLLRNFGVRSVANTSLLRHQLMREAMGLAPVARSL